MEKGVAVFAIVFIVSALLLYGLFTVIGILVDLVRGRRL